MRNNFIDCNVVCLSEKKRKAKKNSWGYNLRKYTFCIMLSLLECIVSNKTWVWKYEFFFSISWLSQLKTSSLGTQSCFPELAKSLFQVLNLLLCFFLLHFSVSSTLMFRVRKMLRGSWFNHGTIRLQYITARHACRLRAVIRVSCVVTIFIKFDSTRHMKYLVTSRHVVTHNYDS